MTTSTYLLIYSIFFRYFSQFLHSIKKDMSTSEQKERNIEFDGSILSSDRILIAPVAKYTPPTALNTIRESVSSETTPDHTSSPAAAGNINQPSTSSSSFSSSFSMPHLQEAAQQQSIPPHRRPSPILAAVVSNRSSPVIQQKNEDITDVSMETLLRVSFTDFHNNPQFGNDNQSAYLGEELSVRPSYQMNSKVMRKNAYQRAFSLEGFQMELHKPCLLGMPSTRSYVNLGESLENISPYSWTIPYIFSCLPSEFIHNLMAEARRNQILAHKKHQFTRRRAASNASSIGNYSTTSSLSIEDATPFLSRINSSSNGESNKNLTASSSNNYVNAALSSSAHNGETATPISTVRDTIHANSPLRNSFKYVGLLYFSKDPSWCPWEYRVGYIFDNYLFECKVINAEKDNLKPRQQSSSIHKIIGFAQLCEAKITRDFTYEDVMVPPSSTAANSSSSSSYISAGSNPSRGLLSFKIEFASTSRRSPSMPLACVWVRTLTDDCMEGLERDLREASELTVEGLYEDAPGPIADNILGKGIQ